MRVLLALGLLGGCARAEIGTGPLEATPDAGSTLDAAPSLDDAARTDAALPALPPDACVPSWIPLLGNPGFDTGVTPWIQQGTIISDDGAMPISPQSGTHAAWLGGGNAVDDRLSQTVAIPADATALRVRLYECFVTADAAGDDDHFTASLRSASGTELEVLRAASNLEVATVCGWTEAIWTASSSHAGETVELFLRGTTDTSYPTSWYVDTLALEVLACR